MANLSLSLGWNPSGAPVADGADFLFPMNSGGGNGGGTLVRLTTSGTVTPAAALGGTNGSTNNLNPESPVVKNRSSFRPSPLKSKYLSAPPKGR